MNSAMAELSSSILKRFFRLGTAALSGLLGNGDLQILLS